jgi:hypothetical protein
MSYLQAKISLEVPRSPARERRSVVVAVDQCQNEAHDRRCRVFSEQGQRDLSFMARFWAA